MAVTEVQERSVETVDAESDSYARDEPVQKPVSKFIRWYRSPLFNVFIVGLISFTQPGIWNALNSTGAGGQQEPYLVNAANALTFGLMVFGCPLFGALANKFGLRNVLILGTLGYAPYSASLYVNNRYGTEWFVLFGAVTCGIAASALWASEGAIALGYPTSKDRGRATGLWLALRQLGQLIGASIQLSLNVKNNNTGKVGYVTYLVLIAIQCLGLPLAFLVSPPQKVIRSDGSKIDDPTKSKNFMREIGKIWALLKTKRIFLLIPILITGTWNGPYLGIYLTKYFSVRARTLGALLAAIVSTIADLFWGWFLDLKFFRRSTRAKLTWAIFSVIVLSLFGWAVSNQYLYDHSPTKVNLDWTSPGFGRGFAMNVLLRFMDESHYVFVYWIVGTFDNDVETLTLSVGILRSFESVGSALSYGVGAIRSNTPMNNLIVSIVLFAAAVPTTAAVTFLVPDEPVDNTKVEERAMQSTETGDSVSAK